MTPVRLLLPLLIALLSTACATVSTAPQAPQAHLSHADESVPHSASAAQNSGTSPAAPLRLGRSPALVPNGPLQSLMVAPTTGPSAASVASLETTQDLWVRIRSGFSMPELNNDLVRQKERFYSSRPESIQRMADRGSKYLFHIVEEIERRGMPLELALLPIVESAFNPMAVSHARAAGMWQFMPATGRDFDLKQNAFRDDRRDVLASTNAALDYLQRLHRRFGDWHLALAAYNWGAGNVSRAMQRNRAAGLGTSYEDLRLPQETREYVPRLQAVANIIAQPARFGVTLPRVGNHPFFDTVHIDRDIDVALVAELAQVDVRDFRQLNPSHNKPIIMAAGTPAILLPWDNALLFQERLRQHTGPTASWTAWRVPTNMTAAAAAAQHGISIERLREVNHIPPRMMLRAGSTVLVPRASQHHSDIPEHLADHGQILLAPEARPVQRQARVTVRRGDTLTSIAQRHQVSVAELRRWNRLNNNATLRVGQTLRVAQAPAAAAAPAPRTQTAAARRTTASNSKTAVR